MSAEPVFVRRCRVCGDELTTPWGPETHSESDRSLREHIERHSFTELMAYAMRNHFADPSRAASVAEDKQP